MASRFIMSEIDSTFITRVVQSLLQDGRTFHDTISIVHVKVAHFIMKLSFVTFESIRCIKYKSRKD